MALIQATGFPKNYFSGNELDSSLLPEKASKIEFLDKLICLVGHYYTDVTEVKSSKIVAGLEPEKTNILLARLGQVASDKNVDHSAVIQRCLKTFRDGTPSNPASSVIINGQNQPLHETSDDFNQSGSPNYQDIKSFVSRCSGEIKQTQQMLMDVISKPKCSENILARPPFRFLYDVILAVDEVRSIGLRDIMW
jgi:hypothetical protein